ncbi:MAG: nucleoside triphosphate pyrophosphohydrolase [Cyanothece sp. SIO1E1]|nr:nucleoside triphosphate pyrophosphohydrolase [Cyanothece sp. SIO1E1]
MSQSNSSSPALAALQHLMEVVAQLRSPDGGCPWDLAQTPQSLTPYVIEEAYEVVDAIQMGDRSAIAEELGDLLLQVVLQAQIASEQGDFDLTQVTQGITEKMIRRHPHVFGSEAAQSQDLSANDTSASNRSMPRTALSVEQVSQTWERIKALEKAEPADPTKLTPKLNRYARSLPPLMAGMKISHKAAAAGFEWENIEGVWEKFHEELAEFQQAIATESPERQQSELGDLLFTVINLARWYNLDPAVALQDTNKRFIRRLSQVEAAVERPLAEYSLAELEAFWHQAKVKIAKTSPSDSQPN